MIDSGTSHTFSKTISKTLVELLQLPEQKQRTAKMVTIADGMELKSFYQVTSNIMIQGKEFLNVRLNVLNIQSGMILGMEFLEHFNAVVDFGKASVTFKDSEPQYNVAATKE